jgi:hypothetical protein
VIRPTVERAARTREKPVEILGSRDDAVAGAALDSQTTLLEKFKCLALDTR